MTLVRSSPSGVQIDVEPLIELDPNSLIGNPAAVTAPATDVHVEPNSVVGRAGGNIVSAPLVTSQVADGQVTNAKLAAMAPNSVKVNPTALAAVAQDLAIGQSQALGRGPTGNLTALSGATLGQFLRFATDGVDPGGSGTVTTLVIDPTINQFRWTPGAAITVHGMALTGPVSPTNGETVTIYNSRTSTFNITFVHNSASAADANFRFFDPGNINFILRPGESVTWRHMFSRWVATGVAQEANTTITLSIAVPVLAADTLGYANTSLVGTVLEGTAQDRLVVAAPVADLAAAGLASGFYIGARMSALNTLRAAFRGTLAGGATNFTVTRLG